ncbi:MAG: hypothetical protein HY275_09015 [Gemmatimonadetes bacterium]|nr:hypothetical protein [Gemmatimonadota bacterium]
MATPSLFRVLPAERRLQLVTHLLTTRKEIRPRLVARIVARGGGFRAATVMGWPLAQLAREFVRLNAASPEDEIDLLQALYLEVEPQLQAFFLDAAGVKHEGGTIPEDLAMPYASAERVATAAAALREKYGDDGLHYLRTIARYNGAAWPGIDTLV